MAIYLQIDTLRLLRVLRGADAWWLGVSLGMVVPLTLLTAWRLQQLVPARLSLAEATRLILMASVLNMVLPSKMGDIAKAYFMSERQGLDAALALALVVFEKACDMLALLAWCAVGLMLYPRRDTLFSVMTWAIALGLVTGLSLTAWPGFARRLVGLGRAILPDRPAGWLVRLGASWDETHRYLRQAPRRVAVLTGLSLLIWFLHLLQIWLFIRALNAAAPFLASLALAALSILAGLLPLTFAGVGIRDAALILLYEPYLNAPTAAALGLLCTTRYVLPAIAGLAFLGQYRAGVPRLTRPTGRASCGSNLFGRSRKGLR